MDGTRVLSYSAVDVLSPGSTVEVTKDFTGDGNADIFVSNFGTGENTIWAFEPTPTPFAPNAVSVNKIPLFAQNSSFNPGFEIVNPTIV